MPVQQQRVCSCDPHKNSTTTLGKQFGGYTKPCTDREAQNQLAQILQDLNMTRLKSEPNFYKANNGAAYILVYVDDLLLIGQDDIVNELF